MVIAFGLAMIPRFIAIVPTCGEPARFTSTRRAARIARRPCVLTTGSCWAALLPEPDQPATFLPVTGQLYFRKSQLPAGETFRTKNELLVELLRQQASGTDGPDLAVFDGAFAVANVVRPLLRPESGKPRIEFVTRLRHDARLYALPPSQRPKDKRGPMPKWGRLLPPPRQGGYWPGDWQQAEAFLYGRRRSVRWKERVCLWRVLGHKDPVKVVAAEVEGYSERFTLVTSAVKLTGPQVLELFCARFRQEDGFRDLKQRLGWEECRAWTKNPIERTTQILFETLTMLRLLERRLDAEVGDTWWLHPPWNERKTRPSVLDTERLLRRHRKEIQQSLSEWLESEGKTEAAAPDTGPQWAYKSSPPTSICPKSLEKRCTPKKKWLSGRRRNALSRPCLRSKETKESSD